MSISSLTSRLSALLFASAKIAGARVQLRMVPLALLTSILFASGPANALGMGDVALPLSHFLNFTTDSNLINLVFGLFIGVMVTASAYLFIIWIVMHDRGQVFLILLLMCLTVNIVATNGSLVVHMGIVSEVMRTALINYSLILSCIFSLIFTYYFLEVDVNLPMLGRVMWTICALLVGASVYSAYNQTMLQMAMPTGGVAVTGVVLLIGAICFYQRISGSFTHMIAFLFFLCGMLAEPLYNLGVLTSTMVLHNLTYLSFSMAAMMFAIVTASQFATRQEEKEKALALSNERFTLATRGANEGLFDWNFNTSEVFFSDQMRRILGLRLENTTDGMKKWLRLVHESDRRVVHDALRRFRRTSENSTINIEYRLKNSGETRRWLHTKVVAVRDNASKKIIRLVGSTSDISTRKQGELALRASEMRFRSITEAHPVPVMIIGLRNSGVLYASPSAERLLNRPQSEIIHHTFDRFLPDDDVRLEIWDLMTRGVEINLKEVRLASGDTEMIDAALSARRISYQNEDAMVIGLYDLTERKQAEAQIARQQEALQQSEKMAALGGLLAGVAHELNNPLSVVVGQATLLMEGSSDEKTVNRADKIFKAADRCSRIVKSFLALARRKAPERKPMHLNAIITGALELLGYQIRTGNVEVVLDLAQDLTDVAGDEDQMTQVVTNLVLNATQALLAWDGTRRLTIRTYNDAEGHTLLSVADSGPGVPNDIRVRIFEPFFTTKSTSGGTGVGLSLCLNIVASHGGQLTVGDTPGGGATFLVTLPSLEKNAAPQIEETAAKVDLSRKPRVLLVDDEVELAQTLAELLEPDGLEVDIAINGAIALEKLHKSAFDVIVSDLRMPVLDGPGLYEALGRELPSYQQKIIFVTGDTLSTHVQAFLKQYTVPVIEKPYRLSDVRRAIETLVKGQAKAS